VAVLTCCDHRCDCTAPVAVTHQVWLTLLVGCPVDVGRSKYIHRNMAITCHEMHGGLVTSYVRTAWQQQESVNQTATLVTRTALWHRLTGFLVNRIVNNPTFDTS